MRGGATKGAAHPLRLLRMRAGPLSPPVLYCACAERESRAKAHARGPTSGFPLLRACAIAKQRPLLRRACALRKCTLLPDTDVLPPRERLFPPQSYACAVSAGRLSPFCACAGRARMRSSQSPPSGVERSAHAQRRSRPASTHARFLPTPRMRPTRPLPAPQRRMRRAGGPRAAHAHSATPLRPLGAPRRRSARLPPHPPPPKPQPRTRGATEATGGALCVVAAVPVRPGGGLLPPRLGLGLRSVPPRRSAALSPRPRPLCVGEGGGRSSPLVSVVAWRVSERRCEGALCPPGGALYGECGG